MANSINFIPSPDGENVGNGSGIFRDRNGHILRFKSIRAVSGIQISDTGTELQFTVPLTVGPQGPQGPSGVPGPSGAQGPIGPSGAQGVQGSTGAQGPQGIQGPIGPSGATGPQGPQGPSGVHGPSGAIGPSGAQGMQGPIGPSGMQGPSGATGPQGPAGPQGPQGIQGPSGVPGLSGATGPQGPIGPSGLQGEMGPSGVQGETGEKGDTGPVGPNSAFRTNADVSQSVAPSSWQTIDWDDLVFDLNDEFNVATSGFAPKTSGVYSLHAKAALFDLAVDSSVEIRILKNDSLIVAANDSYVHDDDLGIVKTEVAGAASAVSGDFFTVQVKHDDSSNKLTFVNDALTFFEGWKLAIGLRGPIGPSGLQGVQGELGPSGRPGTEPGPISYFSSYFNPGTDLILNGSWQDVDLTHQRIITDKFVHTSGNPDVTVLKDGTYTLLSFVCSALTTAGGSQPTSQSRIVIDNGAGYQEVRLSRANTINPIPGGLGSCATFPMALPLSSGTKIKLQVRKSGGVDTLVLCQGASLTIVDIGGAKGDPGPSGTGPPGPSGVQGPPGPQGPSGSGIIREPIVDDFTSELDGSTNIFNLSYIPESGTLNLLWNGVVQKEGSGCDFTLSGSGITTNFTPYSDNVLEAKYFRLP